MKTPSRFLVSLAVLLPLLAACGDDTGGDSPEAAGTCQYDEAGAAAKDVSRPSAEPNPEAPDQVNINTDQGTIRVALDPDKAPCTVNSFLHLADQGYYDGTTCHRLVTEGIKVLQCGDPTATGTGGPGYQFADELVPGDPRLTACSEQQTAQGPTEVCTYPAGTVAMANSGPDTNGSQFFLVYADSPLPNAYTVFGRMSAGGLNVVREIARKGNAANGVAPRQSTTIESIK